MDKKKLYTGACLGLLCAGAAGLYAYKKKTPSENSSQLSTAQQETTFSSEHEESPKTMALVGSTTTSAGALQPSPASADVANSGALKQPAATATKPELLKQLIDMQKQDFDNVRNFLASTMNEISAQISEEVAEDGSTSEDQQELIANIGKATNEALDYIEKKISETYNERFTPEELAELIKQQQDPVFRMVKESANIQDFQDFKQDYAQYVEGMRDNPPSSLREGIVAGLVEDSNLKEVFEKMNQNFAGMQEGPGATGAAGSAPGGDKQFAQQMEELTRESRQGLHYALRNVSDEQLVHYKDVLNQPVMRKGQAIQKELAGDLMEKSFETIMKVIEPGAKNSAPGS